MAAGKKPVKKRTYIGNPLYTKAFGEHLKKLRLKKGLSRIELGADCNIDAKQIARLERGERAPTLSTMYVLAKGLEVHPSKLLQFDF